jgi:dolichol-phosphate mannosyltransferase
MLNTLAPSRAEGGLAETTRWLPAELSVIVPTYNESGNVQALFEELARALEGVRWEVIFVDDDSPDATAHLVRQLARDDPRVRCMRRVGRRGLAGACVEGMLSSSAQAVAIIDADLQHDARLLPVMLMRIRDGADLVVGTRFADGGTATGGFSTTRDRGSRLATAAARRLLGVRLSDPMSGFFMMRRDMVEALAPRLSTQGFKLLLDIVVSGGATLKVVELPYAFRPRNHGESKLDNLVVLEYAGLLLAKLSGDRLSIRFLLFLLVGASGLLVHLVALRAVLGITGLAFEWSQTLAAYVAMAWNFVLNNQLTYRDRKLRGWAALKGLVSFCVVCSVGMIGNVGVANWIYGGAANWWLAGTAGALMGAVFNYAASSALTWQRR